MERFIRNKKINLVKCWILIRPNENDAMDVSKNWPKKLKTMIILV